MPVSYKNKDIIADYAGQIRGKRIEKKDEELLVPVIASSTGFGESDKDVVEMHVYDSAENYLFSDYEIKGWSRLTSLQPIQTADGPALRLRGCAHQHACLRQCGVCHIVVCRLIPKSYPIQREEQS